MNHQLRVSVAMAALAVSFSTAALAKTIVRDGSFEHGRFVNQQENYMALPSGSTTITGWTVLTSSGDIVWAKSPTGDGISAAQGKFCIDLTGFGSDGQNGGVNQVIHLKPGTSYNFSMDVGSFNDALPVVTVGTQSLTLTLGTPFTVNGTSWTPATATFIGKEGEKAPVLTIQNTTGGAQLVFIDNVSITAQ